MPPCSTQFQDKSLPILPRGNLPLVSIPLRGLNWQALEAPKCGPMREDRRLYYSPALMPRRSLRPELNRIRAWVRQGRTDAWIAHQLEVTVQQIQVFKREQALGPEADPEAPAVAADFDDEIDLRAEDDALIAAELDAEAAASAEEEDAEAEADDGEKPKRRRGRRGGRTTARGKRKADGPLEATFDHGEEGYGLWLDPAVQDDPVYAEYWAGHRPVEVSIEEDQIVIRRAGAGAEEAEEAEADADAEA
jgi:hypothetical protein